MRQFPTLPLTLRRFVLGSVVLTALCGFTEVFCALVLHWHYPYNFPMVNPGAITQDLLSMQPHFAHLHHIEFFRNELGNNFGYPAPGAIPYAVFFLVPQYGRTFFYVFCLFVVAVGAVSVGRALVRRGIRPGVAVGFLTATFLLSYPFWFVLKQGNMEIVIFGLLALGVWAFLREYNWLAATCFGVAGSMKFFPFAFLALFLTPAQWAVKGYWKVVYALVTAVALTFASLWMIYPSITYTWAELNKPLQSFRATHLTLFREEHAFDHSLWTFVRYVFLRSAPPDVVGHLLLVYLGCIGVLGLVLYFGRIRLLPVASQVLCLTVMVLLFFPVSFDYTLIQLYTPWAILVLLSVDSARSGYRIRGLAAAFGCFTLLCSPMSEFIYRGVSFEGRIKTLGLIALLIVALRYPFEVREADHQGTVIV
jgi:hypothetical protein